MPRRRLAFLLLASAFVLPGMKCKGGHNPPLATVIIVDPAHGQLTDDPSLDLLVRLSGVLDPATIEVRLEGVDLLAALGAVPPFSGLSGTVMIGGSPVDVSDLTWTAFTGENRIRATLTGLPSGDYSLEADGLRLSDSMLLADANDFTQVGAFSQALAALPAGGLAGISIGMAGPQGTATLGEPLAAPPATGPDGELRSGFVETSEALVR